MPKWISVNAGTLAFSGTPSTNLTGQRLALHLTVHNRQGHIAEARFMVGVLSADAPAPLLTAKNVGRKRSLESGGGLPAFSMDTTPAEKG